MKPLLIIVCLFAALLILPTPADASHGRLGSRVGAVARAAVRPLQRIRARRESRGALLARRPLRSLGAVLGRGLRGCAGGVCN